MAAKRKRGQTKLTPEQRRERAIKANQARTAKRQAAQRAKATQRTAEPVAPEPEPEPLPPEPPPPIYHETATQLMRDVAEGIHHLERNGFSFQEYLPHRLRERFRRANSTGDRLSNFEQVALLDLRISQICERIDTAESSLRWREARAAMRKLTVAMQQGDNDAVGEAYAELNSAINRGANDADNWVEMMGVIETRRRVTETELKRIRSAHDWISAQEAMDLITLISESVARHVVDPTAKALIAGDIERAIGAAGT